MMISVRRAVPGRTVRGQESRHTRTAHAAEGPDKQHKIKPVTWKLQLRSF